MKSKLISLNKHNESSYGMLFKNAKFSNGYSRVNIRYEKIKETNNITTIKMTLITELV